MCQMFIGMSNSIIFDTYFDASVMISSPGKKNTYARPQNVFKRKLQEKDDQIKSLMKKQQRFQL
jgi:hypothetical protein